MLRLPLIEPDRAEGTVKQTLDELAQRGPIGPMLRGMANSSALLRGYLDLSRAMKRSHLDRKVSERISLAVQEWIGCDYCLAAHAAAARSAGLDDTDIALARQGTATDPKIAGLVAFAQQVAAAPSEVTDEQIQGLRDLGWRDEQIADVVGLVALNVMTGSFNLVAGIHTTDPLQEAA